MRTRLAQATTAPVLVAAALLALSARPAPATGEASDAPAPRPNVLLVTLDTTRMDRLGLYGYPRDTSPELDRLAADARVYTRAYSVTSWTLPSHASLFTGLHPASHGADYDPAGPLALSEAIEGPAFLSKYRVRGLSPGPPTLAEILREAGYATGAVVAGPWLERVFGLDRGFDHYDDAEIGTRNGRLAKQVTDAALAWLEGQQGPFFLFLNYFDPHGPYADPEGLARRFLPEGEQGAAPSGTPSPAALSAAYDGEIRYMDRHLGRLLAWLRERDLYDATWIVVTADHGELLGEHGRQGHGFTLYEEELRIPLIVKPPAGGEAPGRDATRVQLTDVMPELLARLGLPRPANVGEPPVPGTERPAYAEVNPVDKPGWRAWLRGPYKYLASTEGRAWLFDLSADPAESRNLAGGEPVRLRLFERALASFRQALPRPAAAGPEAGEAREVDAGTRRALESLGYVE